MSLASFVGKEDRELPGGFREGLFFFMRGMWMDA